MGTAELGAARCGHILNASTEVFRLPVFEAADQKQTRLFAWLNSDEFDRFRRQEGELDRDPDHYDSEVTRTFSKVPAMPGNLISTIRRSTLRRSWRSQRRSNAE